MTSVLPDTTPSSATCRCTGQVVQDPRRHRLFGFIVTLFGALFCETALADFPDVLLLLSPAAPAITEPAEAPHTPRIAIIIDDLGYSLSEGTAMAKLPAALTLAVLPFSPNGVALANLGHQEGKEILLHTPMSAQSGRMLDKGGLDEQMSQTEFVQTLRNNLASIPHVRGVNNHMGSRLTELPRPMQWLMTELRQQQLFFIDSRTTAQTVALDTAQREQVPSLKRDVFLDNIRNQDDMKEQFSRLLEKARREGQAIAIGHPYPETYAFLAHALPSLKAQNVVLVPVSELLPAPLPTSQRAIRPFATPSS